MTAPKRSKKRWALWGVGLLVLAFLVWSFRTQPAEVDVVTATRGPLQVTVNEDGRTRIKERYVVSAPLGGRLLRVELHPGDVVEAGRTLLTAIEPTDPDLLDPRALAQAEARVKSTEAARLQAIPLLERARTAAEFARMELERARKLYQEGTLSQQALDDADQKGRTTTEELKAAQFSLQIADYELELARAALLRTRPGASTESSEWRFPIVSPISGRVLRVFQESSAVVPAGASLLEVGDPTDLEAVIDVLSADAVQIKPGAKVILEHWGGEAPLPGRVRLVEPSGFLKISALGVEEQRVNVIVDFEGPFEARSALGDAFRVEARIVTSESPDVLKIPVGALFRVGDEWAVFAVDRRRARLQSVRIGQRNDQEAEVQQGLAAGDRIIVHPSDKVKAGGSIRLRE